MTRTLRESTGSGKGSEVCAEEVIKGDLVSDGRAQNGHLIRMRDIYRCQDSSNFIKTKDNKL